MSKYKIKKAMKDVLSKHSGLFKKLAPKDRTYTFEYEDLVILVEVIGYLSFFFEEDDDKVVSWLIFENLNLGGVAPISMIQLGRGDKLLSFIKTSLSESGII